MNLRDFLKEEKMTIPQFSEESGIPEHSIKSYIYDGKRPDKYMQKIIAATCGRVNANDFYGQPEG